MAYRKFTFLFFTVLQYCSIAFGWFIVSALNLKNGFSTLACTVKISHKIIVFAPDMWCIPLSYKMLTVPCDFAFTTFCLIVSTPAARCHSLLHLFLAAAACIVCHHRHLSEPTVSFSQVKILLLLSPPPPPLPLLCPCLPL